MPLCEYRCHTCGAEYEQFMPVSQYPFPVSFPCPRCPGVAEKYFSAAPAMSPDPHWSGYYDVQLGRYLSSRDEKRRILKEKGLEEVSTKEYQRGFESTPEKEDVIPEGDPKFRAAMEKAWADMHAGNLEPVTPRKVDPNDATVVS